MTIQVPSLVLDGTWIPAYRSYGGTGTQLVKLVKDESEVIFPDYDAAEFNSLLGPDDEPVFADLVLIAKDNRFWCVLFVVPTYLADLDALRYRIETAGRHSYGVNEAREIIANHPALTWERLSELIIHESPSIVVVTDNPSQNWSQDFSDLNPHVMVVEPFWDAERLIMRVNGEYPWPSSYRRLAICERNLNVPQAFILNGDLPNSAHPIGPLVLWYKDQKTDWQLGTSANQVFLIPDGSYDLEEYPSYEIVEMPGGRLLLRALEKE